MTRTEQFGSSVNRFATTLPADPAVTVSEPRGAQGLGLLTADDDKVEGI